MEKFKAEISYKIPTAEHHSSRPKMEEVQRNYSQDRSGKHSINLVILEELQPSTAQVGGCIDKTTNSHHFHKTSLYGNGKKKSI